VAWADARINFLAALVVVLLGFAGAGCLGGSERQSGGPLREPGDGESWSSAPVKAGQFLVVGLAVPRNASEHEAVLERVEPSDRASARGLELRYAAVRSGSRHCTIGAMRDWPPLGCRGELEPVNGFRVRAGERAMILVGARSQSLGRWPLLQFRLRYHVGDDRYETKYGQGMKLRVVPRLSFAESSASFSSFQTAAHNIDCAYRPATRFLRCDLRSGPCYEVGITGQPRACAGKAVQNQAAAVLKPRDSWLYHGFRCYAGRASIRCRNQVFEGFFLSERRSHRT